MDNEKSPRHRSFSFLRRGSSKRRHGGGGGGGIGQEMGSMQVCLRYL